MKIFILTLTFHACFFMGFSQDLSTPAATVKSFIQAYQSWNDEAFLLKKGTAPEDLESVNEKIEAGYAAFIQQFCIRDFNALSYSYGSQSAHRIEVEKIVKEMVEESIAILSTESGTKDQYDFAQYQYHLQKVGDQWRINKLLWWDDYDEQWWEIL
ncbi:MAG: NTF2 fold immunity protein [Bacteroidota bacterium]